MKKKLITAACTAAIAAIALPAFADHQISGLFRTIMTMENKNLAKDADPDKIVDSRVRMRWQNALNEYVNIVWFGEVDYIWGDTVTKAAANPANRGTELGNGGKQGGDGINVETKHAYLDLKIPNAPLGLAARLGLQNVSEEGAFSNILMDDDMAALNFTMKNDMMGLGFGWAKLDEGANADEDDTDLYFLKASLTPVQGLKLQPQVWFNHVSRTDATDDSRNEYYLGVSGAYKLAPLDLSAWFLYDFGKDDSTDTDISAWAVSAKAAMEVAGAKVGARVIYFPASTSDEDDTVYTAPNGANGAVEFADDGLMIFLTDAMYMDTYAGRRALTDAAYVGYGLIGGVLSASYTPPALKALTLKGSLGYFMLADDSPDGVAEVDGDQLGTEIALQAGYRIADKVDVWARGAYAFLGDFYDGTAGGEDPDDLYKAQIIVNVPY